MNRNVIVPAKKRVNPWTVARVVGLSTLGLLGTWALIVWPWVHVFTADMGPFTFLNLASVLVIGGQVLGLMFAAFVALDQGIIQDAFDSLANWWRDRESKYGQVDDR